jgi:hypothetical protein
MANQSAATAETESKSSAPAAYLSFKTFLGAVDALEHGIPKQIDRTIWRSQSGVIQSQIMMAFRFFGFVNESDAPTPALQRFVEGKDRRPEMMASLIRHSYRSIVEHDLTKMSPKMLSDAMDEYGVSGDTKRKALAFFLRAAQFADIPMHPLLSRGMRSANGPRKKRVNASKRGLDGSTIAVTPNTQSGITTKNTRSIQLSSGGTVALSLSFDPFSLSEADREFVYGLVDKLKAYEQANPPTDEEEEDDPQ